MKIIGLIPGAMKPFHAGHNHLVQTAISECDTVYLFTSIKDRGVISGANMMRAWNELIQPLLPGLEPVKFVRSPVGSVFEYLYDEGTPKNEYRIYGGTDEIDRFKTDAMLRRYPGLTIVNVAEIYPNKFKRDSGATKVPAKGSWVRNSIKAGNFDKFKTFLPNFLQEHALEYWNILTR